MKLRLDLRLSQKLIMTPQLQQAIKLLQLSRLELQQTLTQHLMENPMLEELQVEAEEAETTAETDWAERKGAEAGPSRVEGESSAGTEREKAEELSPSYWEDEYDSHRRGGDVEYPSSSSQDEFPSYDQTATKAPTLEEHLLWQLGLANVSGDEKSIGRIIIGNLDEDGYLRTPVSEIAADAGVPEETVESVLRQIQSFDPAGVGARNLRECLLIQLGYLDRGPIGPSQDRRGRLKGSLVEAIVADHLQDLEKKQYPRIAKALS
ncbi:MAG: RNA polymerase factor sigma-54, partial [Nitrospirales bacterium]